MKLPCQCPYCRTVFEAEEFLPCATTLNIYRRGLNTTIPVPQEIQEELDEGPD